MLIVMIFVCFGYLWVVLDVGVSGFFVKDIFVE